jgi:plastocyanin
MRLALLALPAFLATLALAACGSSSSSGGSGTTAPAGGGQTVSIGESEFKLDPSSVKIDQAGTVTFKVTNNGSVDHALEVEGQGVEEETETIKPGETAELTVDLSKGGPTPQRTRARRPTAAGATGVARARGPSSPRSSGTARRR